ncbi:MAG: hypothetical protein ACR2NN_16670 [Bryobacteraceae bacterium]
MAQAAQESIRAAIERFVETSGQPVLCEPGEESFPLRPESFALECRNGTVVLQVWDHRRNMVRRVIAIESQTRARMVLRVERFGKRVGSITVADLKRPDGQIIERRTARLEFREVFRRFLSREYPGFKIAELTSEADLEHSLSPSYPRALLREGSEVWAAIGAPSTGACVDGILSFGLIWLDYLRRREQSFTIRGLVLFLPAGAEKTTCLRLLFLDPAVAQYAVYLYSPEGFTAKADLRDYGNLDTRLERCQRRIPGPIDESVTRLARIPGVETIERPDGSRSLRVHGLEFARTVGDQLAGGLETKRVIRASNLTEIEGLARGVARLRSADSLDRLNPLYLRDREAWLESRVRAQIEAVDASLAVEPVYGQVPAFAAAERGVIDLLAVDRGGRLAILELKASEDIHLPLQALDYWMRVKWHLERDEFSAFGYFPGIHLRRELPRLFLVAPSLAFHPTTQNILRFFSPAVEVERLGVGIEWQKSLKVVIRS